MNYIYACMHSVNISETPEGHRIFSLLATPFSSSVSWGGHFFLKELLVRSKSKIALNAKGSFCVLSISQGLSIYYPF